MSTYKLKLNQIREVLGMPAKFEVAKLKDGTSVEVEKLEVGFPVLVVNEDGSKTPAHEGYHELENGTKLRVDANGMIAEITTAETETAEGEGAAIPAAMAEETVTETETETETETPIKDAVVEKIEEKLGMLFAAIEECAEEIATVKEEMGAMKTKMEKFSKLPAGNKIPKSQETMAEAFDSVDARVAALGKLRNELNKK
jgi:hypothetical protein